MQPISFTLAISITSNSKRQPDVQTVKRRQAWHGSSVSVRLVNSNRALTAMFLPPVIQFENSLHVSVLTYIRHSIMRHDLQPSGVNTSQGVTRREANGLMIVRVVAASVAGLTKLVSLSRVTRRIHHHLTNVVPSLRYNSRCYTNILHYFARASEMAKIRYPGHAL